MRVISHPFVCLSLICITGCSSVLPPDQVGLDESKLLADLENSQTSISLAQVYDEKVGPPIAWQDILGMTDLGDVAVAPNGTWVAFTSLRIHENEDDYTQSVHVYDFVSDTVVTVADTGQPFAGIMQDGRTNGGLLPPDLAWSPHGSYLAFVVNKNGSPTLNIYDADVEKTYELRTDGEPVYGFVWSEDFETIIYQTGQAQPEVLRRYEHGFLNGFLYDEQYKGAGGENGLPLLPKIPVSLVTDGTLFGSTRAAKSTLKRVSVSGGVGPAKPNDSSFFKDNGGSSTHGPETNNIVLSGLRSEQAAQFEIVGRQIIVKTEAEEDLPVSCSSICDTRILKVLFHSALNQFSVVRSKQGRITITKFSLGSVSEDYKEKVVIEFAVPSTGYGSLGPICDAAFDKLICVVEEPNAPPFLAEIDTIGRIRNIFDPNKELRASHYTRIDRLDVSNTTGITTTANLHYPADYEVGKQYPLVLVQYNSSGFARGGTGNENPILPYTEAGFFVLNYSQKGLVLKEGTSKEIADTHYRSRQPINMHIIDVITDYLSGAGLVDENRIAYTGFSGGSNLIDYLLANGADVAAVIYSQCCIGPDLLFLNPFNLWHGSLESLNMGNPLRDSEYREKYELISPVPHAEKINAAILANISEYETDSFKPMLAWMIEFDKPMEVYIYAGEHHVKTKPNHRAAIYRRNIQWLKFWLQGEELDDPVDPEQYERWRELRRKHKADLATLD